MLCREKVAVCSEINTTHKNTVWADCAIFRRVCKIEKSDYYLRHVRPSVRPHGTNRLPQDGFSCNFIRDIF
jgi:hypothetical protein